MRITTATPLSIFFATSALAQTACETKAVGKDGKRSRARQRLRPLTSARRMPASRKPLAVMESH
jgi:hypothetical protein